MSKSTSQSATQASESLALAVPFNNLMMGTMSQLNGALLDAVVNFQREVVSFAARRLSADLKFQRDLMEVRELGQVGKLQQDWLAATLADYSAETSRLIELVTKAAKEETEGLVEAQSSLSAALSEQTNSFKPSIAAE